MAEFLTRGQASGVRGQASGVRGQDVRAFLARAAREPFVWGVSDCFLLAADWVLSCGRRDPAIGWRGTYRSALAARRLLRRAGGAEALARDAMRGFAEFDPEAEAPRDGDVGLVEGGLELRRGRPWLSHAAALHVNGLWVVRTPKSLIGGRSPLIVAVAGWRVLGSSPRIET
jgi:hypothetical protein